MGYAYALWGMALNNMGWMIVTLLLAPNMTKYVAKLNVKYDPAWIKYLLSGATVGLFAFLLSNALIQVKNNVLVLDPGIWCAAIAAAISMRIPIFTVIRLHRRLWEYLILFRPEKL